MKRVNFIKISGGKYRGKKIQLPNIATTRPSKSIVRNSIFDTLQSQIYNKVFIELFGGSGSVGFEAISRGASKLYLFEINQTAIETLKQNRKNFPNDDIEIIVGDTFKNIERVMSKIDNDTILYIDPPFSIRQGMDNIYIKLYSLLERLSISSSVQYIILEHISSETPPNSFNKFLLYKSKRFGKTTVSYYIKEKADD